MSPTTMVAKGMVTNGIVQCHHDGEVPWWNTMMTYAMIKYPGD